MPAAAQLLQLAAWFAPEPIPVSLIKGNVRLMGPPLGAIAAGRDPRLDLNDVIGAVLAYSLARRSGDTIQLHRLVQAVIRGELAADRRQEAAQTARMILVAA